MDAARAPRTKSKGFARRVSAKNREGRPVARKPWLTRSVRLACSGRIPRSRPRPSALGSSRLSNLAPIVRPAERSRPAGRIVSCPSRSRPFAWKRFAGAASRAVPRVNQRLGSALVEGSCRPRAKRPPRRAPTIRAVLPVSLSHSAWTAAPRAISRTSPCDSADRFLRCPTPAPMLVPRTPPAIEDVVPAVSGRVSLPDAEPRTVVLLCFVSSNSELRTVWLPGRLRSP